MAETDPTPPDDFYDEVDEDCGNCGGEGGYAVCCEDSCPIEGGEECCDDPACWRTCSMCGGNR